MGVGRNQSFNDTEIMLTLARGEQGRQLTNWSKTFSCVPDRYFEPSTVEDIRQVFNIVS